jgi:hypothetical protein
MRSIEPEVRLLSAVVGLAVRDTMHTPIGKKDLQLQPESASAFDFLFTESSDGYFEMLNIDPGHYRKKLIEVMSDTSSSEIPFKAIDRRTFRINLKLWKEQYDRLGRRVAGDASDDEEDSQFDVEEQPRRSASTVHRTSRNR